MKDFLQYYENPNEKYMNYGLINRTGVDNDLISFIVNACKSLEVCENIKLLGYKINSDETTIDPESYITRRSTSKKEQEQKYIFINDNRNIELILEFKITSFDKKSGKDKSLIINKKILLPILDENGYYLLKGKRYYLTYQLLESSTYNTAKGVIVKSFLPISISREIEDLTEVFTGKTFSTSIYTINMFKKERDILLFYFAQFGFQGTLHYFSVDRIIFLKEGSIESDDNIEVDKDKYYYFKINNNLYLEVNKDFFERYKYVRSMTKMIMQMYNSKTIYPQTQSINYYTTIIGLGQSTSKSIDGYQKGKTTMAFFRRMLDINTQLILKLDWENKKDIFALIRCIVQNFDAFRSKDNLDLSTKRLRAGEFVGTLFTTLLSKRFNRIISQKTITLDSLTQLFSFQGNSLITSVIKSGILNYDACMNDLDVLTKMKYTLKGANSQGGSNGKTITSKYRALHPSKLGRLSILAIGNSDPATSGLLCMQTDTHGLSFSDEHDPESFLPEFELDIKKLVEEDDNITVVCTFNEVDEYYSKLNEYRSVYKDTCDGEIKVSDKEEDIEDIRIKYIK